MCWTSFSVFVFVLFFFPSHSVFVCDSILQIIFRVPFCLSAKLLVMLNFYFIISHLKFVDIYLYIDGFPSAL